MVVWSDMVQTIVLLLAVVVAIFTLINHLDEPVQQVFKNIKQQESIRLFDFNWLSSNNFFKQFIAGIFMTIALNGLYSCTKGENFQYFTET